MHDIVSVHMGQAGIQIGSACWELYCAEHGVLPNGVRVDSAESNHIDKIDSFFLQSASGTYSPRAIFIDLEPSVIDEIKHNQYRHLFNPDMMVAGNEDAANNYARGYYTVGRALLESAVESVRKLIEESSGFAGFFCFHSMSGGTGSGFASLMLQTFAEEYAKKNRLTFNVYPSPRLSTAMVEPYNTVLMENTTIENCDCAFIMDNEALYDICSKYLDVDAPNYTNLNRLVAQVISSITSPLRFDGSVNVDFAEFQVNLVPYPRIHFPLISYAPFLSEEMAMHQNTTVTRVTSSCFDRDHQLVKCDPMTGKYMACCLLYRGLIPPTEIHHSVMTIRKTRMNFVKWCPTNFKIGINYQPPIAIEGSGIGPSRLALCMITNTTAIAESWARIDYKFDLMYAKRAFVHWYLSEGMEEDEFMEARENMSSLEKDYEACAVDELTGDTTTGTTTGTTTTGTTNADYDNNNNDNYQLPTTMSSSSFTSSTLAAKQATSYQPAIVTGPTLANIDSLAPTTKVQSSTTKLATAETKPTY